MRLLDKVALITGAGKGIGKAIALKFAGEGAVVVINDIDLSYAESVAEKIDETGKKVLAVEANVSKMEEVESMFAKLIQKFGKVDILINNAGIRRDIPFPMMSEEEWDLILSINLKGSFNCAQVAQKYMVKQNYGKIISISSPIPPALVGQGQVHYSSAGAGLQGFTKALAIELGKYNINVNCIAPDFIDTDMTRESARRAGMYLDDFKKIVIAQIPLRRLGTPEDVANLALFLASDEASFVTGQVIHIRGGP